MNSCCFFSPLATYAFWDSVAEEWRYLSSRLYTYLTHFSCHLLEDGEDPESFDDVYVHFRFTFGVVKSVSGTVTETKDADERDDDKHEDEGKDNDTNEK